MRPLVGPDARAFDVHADAHADVLAVGSRAEVLDRLVEQRRVVAAVIDDPVAVLPSDPDLVWKLVRLDEVAPPHLGTLEPELGGDRVERALHYKARVRAAGATVRR